jgi:hypothetical protein
VPNPLPVRSDIKKVWVFPTASDRSTLFTVHVPFSVVRGKVTVTDPLAEVLAGNVPPAVWVVAPEGLRKFDWMLVTPERSSVA